MKKHSLTGRMAALLASVLGIGAVVHPETSHAQAPAEFYKGKTIQLGVGYPPGGGFDVYTRALGQFIGRHIPGNPNIVVVNMPGASGLNYVRYIHDVAPKDGTQFGMFERGLIPKAVLEPSVMKVDFRDFTWIGSMNSELGVCVLWDKPDLRTVDDIKKARSDVIIAGTSKNGGGFHYAVILQRVSPNIRQVFGYTATGPMIVAAENGEVNGTCTIYGSLETQFPDLLSKKKLNVVAQFAEKRSAKLKDIPTAYELVSSDDDRKIISFLTAAEVIGRPIIAPAGIPADRRDALRSAFMSTMKDPAFMEYAEKLRLDLDPVEGGRAAEIVAGIVSTPTALVEMTRKMVE